MPNQFQKLSSNYQRTGGEAFNSMTRSARDVRKSLHGMSMDMAEFSKKSVNQAIELQAQLAKNAFEAFIAELSKFSMLGLVGYGRSTEGQEEGARSAGARDRGAGSSMAKTTRRAATVRRRSASKQSKASSERDRQRTAAQSANTHKRTGPAKTSSHAGRRRKMKK